MDELQRLWKDLEVGAPDAAAPTPSALPDATRPSASEAIVRRYDRRLTAYLYANNFLAGLSVGLAVAHRDNVAAVGLLLVVALVLCLFGLNVYRTRARLRAMALDFTADLATASTQLIAVIRAHIASETRIARVLVPFSVALGTALAMSFKNVPLQNLWLDERLRYVVFGATVGIVALTYALPERVTHRFSRKQIAELEQLTGLDEEVK